MTARERILVVRAGALGDTLMAMDPPVHTRHRLLAGKLFTPKRLKENEEYRFVSERAENATRKYGVKSVSLLAVKT